MGFLTTLLTVSAPLVGVWIANKNNEKRFKAQLLVDESKDNKKLLLEKSEELYLCLISWSKFVNGYNISQLSAVINSDRDILFSYLEGRGGKDTHDRIETLLSLYFADDKKYMQIAVNLTSENNIAYDNYIRGDVSQEKLVDLLTKNGKSIQENMSLMQDGLAKKVHNLIR